MEHAIEITYKWDSRTEFKISFIGNTIGIMVSYGSGVFNYTSNVPLSVLESVINIYHRIKENANNRNLVEVLMHEDNNIVSIIY